MARSMTWAFWVDIHPSARASPTGANTFSSIATASRTTAGPAPLCPPAVAVRKSCVEAQPTCFTAPVASSSRTTCSSSASRLALSDSTSATVSISSAPSRAAQRVSISACAVERMPATTPGTPPALEVRGGLSGRSVMGQFKRGPPTVLIENPLCAQGILEDSKECFGGDIITVP